MAYENTIDKVIGIKSADVAALNTEIALPVNDATLSRTSGAEHRNATGKRKPYGTRPGQAEATGSFEFILTPDHVGILDLGILEAVNEFEYNEGDGLRKATGCKVTSLTVSGESAGDLVVSVDFTAEAIVEGVAITAEAALDDVYNCMNVTSGLASGANVESFEISVDNNFDNIYGMVGASRLPAHQAPGYQTMSLAVNYIEDPDIDPVADSLASEGTAETPIELEINQGDGSNPSITFEFVDLRPADTEDGISAESIVKYDSNYIAKEITYETTGVA